MKRVFFFLHISLIMDFRSEREGGGGWGTVIGMQIIMQIWTEHANFAGAFLPDAQHRKKGSG